MIFSKPRRGVAVVVVVLIVIAAIITAMQIYFFSRNVYRQTARGAFGTTAEYLAEAAAEEGFYILQTECNKAGTQLYDVFRKGQGPEPITLPYVPERLFFRMSQPENAETFKPYPVDRIEASMKLTFAKEPFHPMELRERSGEALITAIVRPAWGRGEETYRRVELRKPFRVQLATLQTTFDRRALTLFKPDYINGASKQWLDENIVQKTNQAIVDTNNLNNGYESAVNDRRTKVTSCGTCKGTDKFMKFTISSGARIPDDFFKNESILLGNPDRDPLEKLSDFNYEDILRDMYPPLYQIYNTIYTVSNINLQVYRVIFVVLMITDMLRYVPYVGQAMQAIHTALDQVAKVQEMIGKITCIALKIILEGVIIGQPTDAAREAAKGNFAPVLDGIQTSLNDVQASGALDKMKGEGNKWQSAGDKASAASAPKDTGAGAGAAAGQGQATGAAGGATGGAAADPNQARMEQVQKDKEFFTEKGKNNQNDPAAKEKAADYEKRFKGLDGLKSEINADNIMGLLGGVMGKGEFSKAGPLDKFGTDSDLAMVTGLIKGFVKGHRAFYSTEFEAGGDQYGYFVNEVTKLYEAYYLLRAGFVLKTQEEFDAFIERHRESGVNGVIYFGDPDASSAGGTQTATPLVVNLPEFHGQAVIYASNGIKVDAAQMRDPKSDLLVLVTAGSIELTGPVQAGLAAAPRGEDDSTDGGALILPSDADIFGSLFLRRYTQPDNERDGQNSVKGKLEFNPLLQAEGPDGPLDEKLWVTFSPVERGREVFLK